MAKKKYRKQFSKFRRKYQDVGGLKNPSFPAFLNLLTWDALPPRQGVGRGGTRVGGDIASLDVFYFWKMLSLIFIFPNDMPDHEPMSQMLNPLDGQLYIDFVLN